MFDTIKAVLGDSDFYSVSNESVCRDESVCQMVEQDLRGQIPCWEAEEVA